MTGASFTSARVMATATVLSAVVSASSSSTVTVSWKLGFFSKSSFEASWTVITPVLVSRAKAPSGEMTVLGVCEGAEITAVPVDPTTSSLPSVRASALTALPKP